MAHALLGPATGRLLDIGSGEGEDLRRLTEMGWHAVGVEPFQEADALPWVKGTADRLPFKDCSFSAVACVLVLPHINERERAVQDAFRVLRPGGVAVFVVFSRSPLNATIAARGYGHSAGPSTFHLFSRGEFDALISGAGFRSVAHIQTDFLPWLSGILPAGGRSRLYSCLDAIDKRLGASALRVIARKIVIKAVKP